jgi:cell division protein FtsB
MIFVRNRLSVLVMLSCLGLLGAIGWQGYYGHRNVQFRKNLDLRAAAEETQLAEIVAQRIGLEKRVALLRPGTIDADLVDEIARRDLNMGGKHDLVVHIAN